MPKPYDTLRVRLIQVRLKPDIVQEEQQSFLTRCELRPDQLLVTNAIQEPLDERVLEDVDAVMIGGAGAFSVTKTYPWTQNLIALVGKIEELEIPLFGSCWGHQFIARAFGGSVIHDLSQSEMGCHEVELTEAGAEDLLFSAFPNRFRANMGHQDRVSLLPESAVELARNDRSPHQAFRIDDKPIYGTQFHSELDATSEYNRLIAYRDHYPEMQNPEAFQAVIDSLAETTEVDQLLRRFLEHFATV